MSVSSAVAARFTPERIFRGVIIAVVTVGAALLLWYFSRLVIYLLVGMLLAYIMRPIKDWIQGFGIGPIASILITFVAFFGLIGLLVTYLVPFIAAQSSEVSGQLSQDGVVRTITERLSDWLPVEADRIRETMMTALETLLQEDRLTTMAGSVFDLFTNIFYAVAVVPFVAFFFLKDGSKIRTGLLQMIPNRFFEISMSVVEQVENNIGRYFRALLVQGVAIATVATITLSLAGLDYALAVGVFTGLANTIPYFGPIIGFVAGAVVGISQTGDFSLLFGVAIAMGITQLSDNMLLQPLIFSRAARAHPLVILFAVLIGAQVAGIFGMLVAIPLTTTLRVSAREVLWSMRNYRILRTS